MVAYTLEKYSGDASKVFVTGSSSGAMMTNVMAATYPELFKAATAYSGVPAGCFVSTANQEAAWNSTCAQGQVDASPEYWTSVVEGMYEGYSGARPRFQVYHGSVDTTLLPNNYNETVKEWTGVFGYDYQSPDSVEANSPKSGYTRDVWGVSTANPLGTVQGIYAVNVGHTVPIDGDEDMKWFGLGPYESDSGSAPAASSTAAASSAESSPTTAASSAFTTDVSVPATTEAASSAPLSTATASPVTTGNSTGSDDECTVVYITRSSTAAPLSTVAPVTQVANSTAGGVASSTGFFSSAVETTA
ncbi:hypothetical protein LTR53_018123, partial [Teratosphaeriaceae sp. CCFEE 6253]